MLLERTTTHHLGDEDHLVLVLIEPGIDKADYLLMANVPQDVDLLGETLALLRRQPHEFDYVPGNLSAGVAIVPTVYRLVAAEAYFLIESVEAFLWTVLDDTILFGIVRKEQVVGIIGTFLLGLAYPRSHLLSHKSL